jgi:hypothetical protein
MKFTKEEACKELVRRMTEKGETLNLSERSINEQIENLMPLLANEETELSAFVDTVLPICKTADANIRHDVSVGIAEFKKTYTPPKEDDKKVPPTNEGVDEELLKRLSALEDKLKAGETKEKLKEIQNTFIAKVKEKGVKDDEWLKGYMEEITIGEDFDVESRAESCLKFYNKTKAAFNNDFSVRTGGGSAEDKYMNSVISSLVEAAKADKGGV